MTQTQQPAPDLSPDISVAPIRKRPARRKPFLVELYQTGVGKKWVMAVTGVDPHGVRARPHGRQPEDVPRPDRVQHTTASSSARSSCRSCPAPSSCGSLRIGLILAFVFHIHCGLLADADEPEGQRPATYQPARLPRRQLRRPHDALDAASSSASSSLFHLADLTWGVHPIAPPHWTGAWPTRTSTESLKRGRRRRHLHRGQHRPRHPPLPRRRGASSRASVSTTRASTGPGGSSPPGSPP